MRDASPASSPRRRRAATWAVLGLAAVAGAVVLVLRLRTPTNTDESPSDASDGASGLAIQPRDDGRAVTSLPDPFVPPSGPLATEEARTGLSSRLEALRLRALEEIVRRGAAADPALTKLLQEMASGPEGRVRSWAQAALMKIEGSRRFARELAEHAALEPFPDFYRDLVRLIDPAAGDAMIRALKAVRERAGAPGSRPIPGLDEAVSALAADPKTGGEAVAAFLRAADPTDEPAWMEVAAGVKPVPTGVAVLMAERIRGGTPEPRDAALGFLLRNDLDLSNVPDDLPAALASHLPDREDPIRGAVMRAIGRLHRAEPETIQRIVHAARDGEQASFDALIALRNLGPKARPFVHSIIDLEPSLTDTGRFLLAQALLAIGGEGVGSFAAARLGVAGPAERAAWVEGASGLASVPDATAATDAMAMLARTADHAAPDGAVAPAQADARRETPLLALARIDPAGSRESTAAGIADALSDPRPERRSEGIRATLTLVALPATVGRALARLADDPDLAVRRAALEAIAGAWRFGTAGKPLVPAALVALHADGETAAKSEVRVGLVRTIGAAAPDAAEVRTALRTAVGATNPDERIAGLHSLSRVVNPAPEERRAVAAAAADDPIARVRSFATAVLALPAWR